MFLPVKRSQGRPYYNYINITAVQSHIKMAMSQCLKTTFAYKSATATSRWTTASKLAFSFQHA